MLSRKRITSAILLASQLFPIAVGLVFSALLLVDYIRPEAVFCTGHGGCETIRQTRFAGFFGIPTPVFGVLGFIVLGALALSRGLWARAASIGVAAAASSMALLLLNEQRTLGVYCTFCVVTDLSALVATAAIAYRFKIEWDLPKHEKIALYAAVGFLGLALAVPLVVGALRKPVVTQGEVPAVIAEELRKSPQGITTVIDFVDFECPFCRMTHQGFEPLLEKYKTRLRVVRRHVPLAHIHPRALDAARAACCAEILGKGEGMANALFRTPVEELTPEGCEKLASELSLPLKDYRACIQDPKITERIQSDMDMFRKAAGRGLPTIWIDQTKLEGAQGAEDLQRALEEALAKAGS